jgi:hypothetical protein
MCSTQEQMLLTSLCYPGSTHYEYIAALPEFERLLRMIGTVGLSSWKLVPTDRVHVFSVAGVVAELDIIVKVSWLYAESKLQEFSARNLANVLWVG